MNLLQEYYNAVLFIDGMRSFDELSEDEKIRIEKMLGFQLYKSNKALTLLMRTIDNEFRKLKFFKWLEKKLKRFSS